MPEIFFFLNLEPKWAKVPYGLLSFIWVTLLLLSLTYTVFPRKPHAGGSSLLTAVWLANRRSLVFPRCLDPPRFAPGPAEVRPASARPFTIHRPSRRLSLSVVRSAPCLIAYSRTGIRSTIHGQSCSTPGHHTTSQVFFRRGTTPFGFPDPTALRAAIHSLPASWFRAPRGLFWLARRRSAPRT